MSVVSHYSSPANENSVAKNIPIELLEQVRAEVKTWAAVAGQKLRIRFRGPRRDAMRLTCLKQDARSFSVYLD